MKIPGNFKYVTARAIIIENGRLLVFHRRRRNRLGKVIEYYSIPGGKIEEAEHPEQAVVRELAEEMGIVIRPLGLVAHHEGLMFEHYVFCAKIIDGEARFMPNSEEALHYDNQHNSYDVAWVPLEDISRRNLRFYGMFYRHIQALGRGEKVEDVAKIPAD